MQLPEFTYQNVPAIRRGFGVAFTVTTVIRKYDDRQSIETPQGRAYKHVKKQCELQSDLFEDGKKST